MLAGWLDRISDRASLARMRSVTLRLNVRVPTKLVTPSTLKRVQPTRLDVVLEWWREIRFDTRFLKADLSWLFWETVWLVVAIFVRVN